MAPPPPTTPDPESQDQDHEQEQSLTLLVLAGVTSLRRVQALVTRFVSTAARERQGPGLPGSSSCHPDLILALGPFALGEEGGEEEGACAGVDAVATAAATAAAAPLPPWRAAPLDPGTVEGRAAAGGLGALGALTAMGMRSSLRWG